jgi:CRP-like cAMP-binding protein
MPTAGPKVSDEELQLHPFFADLDATGLDAVRVGVKRVLLAPGERLFEMGERADRFWLVRAGRIKLYRIAPNGAEKVVEVIGPGQTFAEAVMFLTLREYPVHSEALTEAEVLGFDADRFLAVLRGSPETCLRVLGGLSLRLRRRIDEIEALSLQNSTLRVITWLLQNLPNDAGAAAAAVPVIRLDVQKKVLASRLSLQPETLSRVLHTLADRGVIAVEGPELKVLDATRLRALALE